MTYDQDHYRSIGKRTAAVPDSSHDRAHYASVLSLYPSTSPRVSELSPVSLSARVQGEDSRDMIKNPPLLSGVAKALNSGKAK